MIGLEEAPVTAWLVANVEGVTPPCRFTLITGGHSNLTYRAKDAAGRSLVLRRPPLGRVLATAHDMVREHRIISAIGTTPVPVPPALGLCVDERVNGAPFYVMDYVDGVVLDSREAASDLSPGGCRTLAEDLIDVLAELHAVDVDGVGLGDLARRDGYVERQLRRWSQQWQRSKTRELATVDELEHRLRQHIPVQQGATVVHGDYRFGNCLVDPTAGRITAVLDWELCTLGDPLADLGYLGVYWTDSGSTPRRRDPSAAGTFPPFAALVERYAARTGRDVAAVEYFRAFSSWRLAVILEGVYARYLHGVMGEAPQDLQQFAADVEQLAESALASLDRSG